MEATSPSIVGEVHVVAAPTGTPCLPNGPSGRPQLASGLALSSESEWVPRGAGPGRSDVAWRDSDAIRVRVRARGPGRIGVAMPRVTAGRGDPCTAGGKEVAGGGEQCRRGDVIEVVKVWGRVIGPGWRLRRGPGPGESVLERKPCRRS